MNTKRLLGIGLSLSMLVSGFGFAYASETDTDVGEVTTASAYNAVDDVYADFPMAISKTIRKDMGLSIQMKYVKEIASGDVVSVDITDAADGSAVASYELSADDTGFNWDNVENDKTFEVTVNDGSEYVGYVTTKFVAADFPVDMMLGNTEYNGNNGETFSHVSMKKVGEHPVCNHEEDEECTDSCKTASLVQRLSADDMMSFYSSLDSDCYYELQVEATLEGNTEFHQAFVSTYADGESMGVFTRGYEFTLNNPAYAAATMAVNPDAGIMPMSSDPADYDFSDVPAYELYRDEYINNLTGSDEYIIKFLVPETGSYTVEMIGNLDTQFYEFNYNEDTDSVTAEGRLFMSGGTGNNPSKTMEVLEGKLKYYVISLEDGDGGRCAFRITRNDKTAADDGISGYRSVVQAAYDAGNFSPISNSCKIAYNGDYNVFAYNISKGISFFSFDNITTDLTVNIYSITGRTDGFDTIWIEDTLSVPEQSTPKDFSHDFTSAGIHYVEIQQADLPYWGSVDYYDDVNYTYDFNFYDSKLKDAYEYTNGTYTDTPVNPLVVTVPYSNTQRTLHRGDSDCYSFTTGADGGNLIVELHPTSNGYLYDVALYDEIEIVAQEPPEWIVPNNIGTLTTVEDENRVEYTCLTYEGLLPNHTYYVQVERASSTVYSSAHPYEIFIDVTFPIPAATLSEDVSLTHTIGEDITDVTAMKNTVMEKLTCTIDGVAIDDSVAVEDVELYYNDSVLTASVVNALTAGTYQLLAKYQDVTATGANINLVVNEPVVEENIIMLENLPLESVTNASWDWAGAARIMANTRLIREGSSQTTYTVAQAIMAVKTSGYTTRGTIEEVVKAANYFYSGGSLDTYNFINDTISISTAESTLSTAINNGQTVIMQLTSISNPSDLTAMRYIILCGINLTTHEYIVYDPVSNQTLSVSQDTIHNGGYNGNADLKFTGQVIEFL